MEQISRTGAGVSSQVIPTPAAALSDGPQPALADARRKYTLEETATPAPADQSGDAGAGGLKLVSTAGEPPHVFKPVAELFDEDPATYVQALCFDVFRGMAWRVVPKEGEQRWGLIDKDGSTYGSHARDQFARFLIEELHRMRLPQLHVAVSSAPMNGIRVVVHSGEIEFFDRVFRFANARIV